MGRPKRIYMEGWTWQTMYSVENGLANDRKALARAESMSNGVTLLISDPNLPELCLPV